MNIAEATVLITGANRGLGLEFARQVLDRGAKKVYATSRRPEAVQLPGIDPSRLQPLRLDITDPDQIAAAGQAAPDVDLLINNAGIATIQNLVTGDLDLIRAELDTHFWGTLGMIREFAPILQGNGGGAILNVMSILSFRVYPGNGAYAAGKAAEWALTNSARLELAGQGTQVTGVHLSSTDTDMMAGWDIDKNDPVDVVRIALDGLERGDFEVLADDETRAVKAQLSASPEELYAGFLTATR